MCRASILCLFFPATFSGLLPVGALAAGRFRGLPVVACGGNRHRIAPIKHQDKPRVTFKACEVCPINEKPYGRLVRIFVGGGDTHRMLRWLDTRIRIGAMWQKTVRFIGPEQGVERFDPFGGNGLNDRPPATFQRLLDQARKDLLKGLAFEMVEQYLGHGVERSTCRDAGDFGPERIQSFVDPLIAALDLLSVVDRACALSAQRRQQHRHPGTNVGAFDPAAA
jgi:hypothetical protein